MKELKMRLLGTLVIVALAMGVTLVEQASAQRWNRCCCYTPVYCYQAPPRFVHRHCCPPVSVHYSQQYQWQGNHQWQGNSVYWQQSANIQQGGNVIVNGVPHSANSRSLTGTLGSDVPFDLETCISNCVSCNGPGSQDYCATCCANGNCAHYNEVSCTIVDGRVIEVRLIRR